VSLGYVIGFGGDYAEQVQGVMGAVGRWLVLGVVLIVYLVAGRWAWRAVRRGV